MTDVGFRYHPLRRMLYNVGLLKHPLICVYSRDGELYIPGTTLQFQFQPEGCKTFEPLAAKIIKPFKPFTSAVVLLVQRLSDNEQFILRLADRRLGYRSNDIEVP